MVEKQRCKHCNIKMFKGFEIEFHEAWCLKNPKTKKCSSCIYGDRNKSIVTCGCHILYPEYCNKYSSKGETK